MLNIVAIRGFAITIDDFAVPGSRHGQKDGPTLPKLQVKYGKSTFNLNIRT